MFSSRLIGVLVLSTSVLAACGGGNGGSGNGAQNEAPQALAGADQAVVEGSAVTLDGSASFDSDGHIRDYEWIQIAGPAVTLAEADTEAATFTAPSTDTTLTLDFRLNVTDNRGASASDEVRVIVTPENTPVNAIPVAANDSAAGNEDQAVTVDVLANDSDADGAADLDPASIAVANVQNGSAAVNAGKVVFTPAANFNGTAGFSYTVRDRQGAQSNLATVTIAVASANDAPVATAASASGQKNQPISGQLTGSDIDGDALTFAKAGEPAHGTVTVASTGSYTYTPAASYTGADSFTFTVSDGSVTSAPATVSISITAGPNSAPQAANDSATTAEDAAVTVDVLANDADADGAADLDPASIAIVNTQNGGAAVSAGKVVFTPAANFHGAAGFSYTVRDRQGASSNPATAAITVTSVNDAPVANAASATGQKNQTISGQLSGSDVDGDALSFSKASDPAHGTVTVAATGSYTYTPAPGYTGTDSFTFTVSDGTANSAPATVNLTITSPGNAAPQAFDDGSITDEDTPVTIDVLANDVDTDSPLDPASITIVSQSKGVATVANGKVGFLADANYFGTDAGFSYTVADTDGSTSNVATVVVTVKPVNDAPAANDAAASGDEETTITGSVSASDIDGDPLTYAKASDPAHGTVELSAAGAFTYVPATNFSGTDSFTFTANDGSATSAPATVTLTVANQPEASLSVGDVTVAEDAGSMAFTVTLSRAPDAPVTIHYATADGTARAGSDYASASGDLLFDGEVLSQTVSVAITDDAARENAETLTLVLEATGGADSVEAGSDFEATGTITDNDPEDTTSLRIGAARRSIQPAQAHIDGVEEARAFGAATHLQKFNLGGFGINPLSNTPDDPAGLVRMGGEALTEPASQRVYTNAAGVEENTSIRALAVQQPGGDTVVFLMMDAVGAGNIIQKGVKNAVIAAAADAGVTLLPENILFGQTHTHAGADLQGLWGGVPQAWINDVLYPQAAAAVREALESRQPAVLRFRQGSTSEFNSYRRPRIEPSADADSTITLVEATAADGTPIGSILGYNAHPTSVNEDGARTPHPDYILGAMDWLESRGGVALYYNGPIADASGSGSRAGCAGGNTYANVRCRGEGMADYLLHDANATANRELAPTVNARSVEVYLPVTNPGFLAFGLTGSFNRYYNFMDVATDMIPGIEPYLADLPQLTPVARTHVSRITLGGEGGLEIVTIPGEATNTFGQYIRGLAGTNVMLLGLTHNSFGYIIPEDEFSYVDQTGDTGLVLPFTGYEEMVSLGPLTAPMLRAQAYNRLFDVDPAAGDTRDVPPSLRACVEGGFDSAQCLLRTVENRIDLLISQWLIAGVDAAAAACHDLGAPDAVCALFDGVAETGSPGMVDALLAPELARTAAQGCDFLDTANCMFPFPNDFFTVDATPGSPQSSEQGGTGRRVNFNPLGMPRNSAGKPVDPTEWNRNDGFSPGQMIVTYVPGLKADADGTIPGAVPITDVARSNDADAPIFVIDADTGERHLIWAEIDLNANLLLHGSVPQTEENFGDVQRPLNDGRSALIIRPAKNFTEGHRYIVALRNLPGANGEPLTPSLGFRACRGDAESTLRYATPMRERCDHIEQLMDELEDAEGASFDRDDLYLTWDFTVASAKNNVGRLAHMRDAAFNSLATVPGTDCTQLTEANAAVCAAPKFTVDKITENPQSGIARRIEGTITVPSFVTPVEATPADNAAARQATSAICNGVPQEDFNGGCADVTQIGGGAALPPNRLFYNPSDATPTDPTQAPYGDGLPDSVGTMETAFICQIPEQALTEPARASIYGHGLLDARVAVTYEGSPEFEREHNFMYCAVDLFGFATGDLANVASTLVDLSNFPVVPDGSQQGLLNYMFLARAIGHPDGFLGNAAFQNHGAPLFDRREVFYNGNSQGGIVGGVVLAISKDINRGVLGSLGMNYSTLLQRSKDFDPYSTVLYSSYTEPLDRMFLFSMMQMLWDRSENNGYAEHLTTKSEVEGGPVDHVMLNSMFADQQVTSWSADVMARTMDIPVDYAMIDRAGKHHPDLVPGWPQPRVGYDIVEGDAAYADASSVLFDYSSREFSDNVPVGNIPMREGPDPHDISHRRRQGRCQISHWLQRDGRLLNLNTDAFTPEAGDHAIACPAVHDNSGAPAPGEVTTPPATDLPGALSAAVDRFIAALSTIPDHLASQDFVSALDAVIGGTQQLGADVLTAVTGEVGAGAGIALPPPVQAADPELPAAQPLMAGAAKRAIQVPVGTPLGGYLRPPVGGEYIGDDAAGEVTDNAPYINDGCDPTVPESCIPNAPLPDEARKAHSPYATASPPSRGYYDSLTAKAVALYDGHDYIVMVKTDFIGMLDEVVQDVKADVKTRKGIDLGDGLIMSATHTHDGPGALANHSTRYFWLAMDTYQHDVYRKLVGQLADVVIAALDDLKPARIGNTVALAQQDVNHFRRGRLESYKDNDTAGCAWCDGQTGLTDADELRRRIGLLRIDDAATGEPRALVINFGVHGIAFDVENQFFSGDVIGSLEREVEQTFVKPADAGDDYAAPIAMLVQNTGGDITPSADYSIRGIEAWGKRFAPEVRALADGISEFQTQPDLRTVSQRIILNRERLGYKEDEYPYPWGAAQCGNDLAVPFADVGVNDIPGYGDTGLPTKHLYCIPATPPDAEDLADNGVAENGAFVPGDTILTAAKIGDLTLMVQPGEPLTEYGVRSLEMAQGLGFDPAHTFVWGYSGDHVGYILPPVEQDWATFGGAESTTTFWGWKQGERFIKGHSELLLALRDGKAAPADEFKLDYSLGKKMVENTPAAPVTPSILPGTVVAQPSNIKRFEKTAFVFEGGDPVLDFPSVLMVHAADGSPVRRANGEALDTFFEMHLKYRLVSGRHLWTVEFEAPKDWATGSYRFVVSGKASQGTELAYSLESADFAVAPASDLGTQLSCADGRCTATVKYTARPLNYRNVDPAFKGDQAAPMRTGSVTFTNDTGTFVVAADGSGTFSAAIEGTVTAKATDRWGNTAADVTVGGSAADQDGDGVPDASDQCPAEAGPASNNGCPETGEPPAFPVPLCEPFAGYCLRDIPVIGEPLEDAIVSAWETINGGGSEPPPVGVPGAEPVEAIVADAAANAQTLPADLQASAEQTVDNAANGTLTDRSAEVVVMEGKSFADWSQPAAMGLANPYPSGVGGDGDVITGGTPFYVRDAHNGTILYPPAGFTGLPTAAPVGDIAAFKYESGNWVEIPVQVDERFPYFLANANSGFSFYSGTDMELTYAWDRETWKAEGECQVDPASVTAMADPVPGLDDDDEIAFMAGDAGEQAPVGAAPADSTGGQEIALADPLNPGTPKFVYLFRRAGGSSFDGAHYVQYTRDADADQWVDRTFWTDSDPAKLGTSNTGYGPNLSGTVCPDGSPASAKPSNDRFPRDGMTVETDKYKVYASGRWMVRNVHIAKPGEGNEGRYGADIIDRWKGRAFQQSPDSTVSLVGFEDEQVNWEANSALLGERVGPVRAIREIWGADSGTNVTKTETYYRDAYVYRFRARVHPIPPDGLYTSWDYNRGAMVPAEGENVPGGRYYTAVRGAGVPIDGINDDIGQIDQVDPVAGYCVTSDGPQPAEDFGGVCPLFFDTADPTLNLPLTMYNWEQIAAKGDLGSLVYMFELKSATIGANSIAMPYYRDDACLDDGTGDDPVQRPWPGESYRWNNGTVPKAYDQRAGRELDHSGNTPADCLHRQGAHAQHGIHFFAPPESDNATMPVPVDEIDGQQWAFAVPMAQPTNVGERYANILRAPLVRAVVSRPAAGGGLPGTDVGGDYDTCVAMAQQGGAEGHEAAAKFSCAILFGGSTAEGSDADGEIQGPTHYVAMNDGTLIATNIYIPWGCNVAKNPEATPCASILEMSGYDGGSDNGPTPSSDFEDILTQESGGRINGVMPLQTGSRSNNNKYYRSGDRYVSVVASVRGSGCSAGEFDLFSRKSALDGRELIEWMADQSWSNGKVGLFGHSYSGITAAMIASTAPPSLKMVTVSGQIGDLYRDIVYPGGVSNYGFPLLWTGGIRVIADIGGGQMAGIYADTQDRQCAQNVATHTRTLTGDPLINGLGDTDSLWYQERSVVNYLHRVNAPTQVVTAYQDEQTGPRGGTNVFDHLPLNLTRRLVMLNGNHGSQVGPAEVTAERRFWMDRFMLDANDPIATRRPREWAPGNALPEPQIVAGAASSRVLLEVSRSKGTRSNGHIDSSGFPLSQTQWTDYYFQAAAQLDSALPTVLDGEDGASSSYASGSKRQAYSYTANGYIGNDDADTPVSVTDANGVDELAFTLPASDTDLVFAGPVTADLFLSTTGVDTELMVQLIDRDPATGERLYLQRGVLKASHRAIAAQDSQCAQQGSGGRITSRPCALNDNIYRPHRPHDSSTDLVTPNQITRYTLEIFPVGHVLRAGHELVVKIHAPSLDDNDWAYIPKTAPALNTLFHSAQHPSSIRLPLVALADVQRLGDATGTCDDSAMRCVIEDSVPNPPDSLAAQCRSYAAQDPTGIAMMFCDGLQMLADAFGDGAGQVPAGDVMDPAAAAAATVTGTAGNTLGGSTGEELAGPDGRVLAGVGVVDMTPDVGYGSGQYTDANTGIVGGVAGGDMDPYLTGKKQQISYGVMSRLTGRAIVIEGSNGKRIALLKSDNYLAQDNLIRRVGQILADKGSTIGYDQILYGVTHAHSSSYYSGSPAVAAFQDAFDPRFFENQARKLAAAILLAERDLKPARMGATTVRHKVFKGQIMGPTGADDGTPVQYPSEYGDHGLVVMRIETDEAQPQPIAVWVNWGEHPEGLDGYNLHSADYVAFLERFVERDLGAPLVFSQGDVGSSEKSGNTSQRIADDGTVCNDEAGETCATGEGVWRDWNHNGYVQNERNVRFLADAVVKGWKVIGGEQPADAPAAGAVLPNNYVPEVQVPVSNSFPVDYRNGWVPGPLSHPYPAVSNCRAEPTVAGDTGVPVAGLPDCGRDLEGVDVPPGSNPVSDQLAMIYATAKAEGLPVPEHYDAPSFGLLEENLRLKLQAFRIGDIVLGSCACEAQVDLILNFESRANDVGNDIYDGFDWACVAEDKGQMAQDPAHAAACELQRQKYFDVREFPTHVPGSNFSADAIAHMRAQVHNPADGWDAPEYVPYANAEPADPTLIKGNFTKEELHPAQGYKLAVGIGHGGDYNGYTVSYREYMSHDHYRKALTAYGPHTADYMVTRLVRMAGAMKGAPEMKPEPHDTLAQADEARMVASSTALGQSTKNAYEAYFAELPPDVGPAAPTAQPSDIGLFTAANFSWRGGSTQIDNPRVVVERKVAGAWQFFADQTGEVQTRVQWPQGPQGVAATYAGQQEWLWTANFEAYEAFPARLGSTPAGTYRFVVEGCINDLIGAPDASLAQRAMNFLAGLLPGALLDAAGLEAAACRGGASAYALESEEFEVLGERELVAGAASDATGTLTITIAPTSIPKTYASQFPYVTASGDNGRFCKECSFRPWATSNAAPMSVSVTVDATGETFEASGSGATWTAAAGLADGASATIVALYADGTISRAFAYTRHGSQGPAGPEPTSEAPQLCAPEQIPEIGGECASDNGGEAIQDAINTAYDTVTGGF